jgi:hypothetical protein
MYKDVTNFILVNSNYNNRSTSRQLKHVPAAVRERRDECCRIYSSGGSGSLATSQSNNTTRIYRNVSFLARKA